MEDNREKDKKLKLYPVKSRIGTSLDQIKSLYIADNKSPEEISEITGLDIAKIKGIVQEHNLPELRNAYIRNGIQKLQNQQLLQAERLMDIETNFKKLRIKQLEDQLKDFVAYYERHGDFYKRHPQTGEILYNTNDMPMQLSIPNVSKEIKELKEAVSLSEGMKTLLDRFDEVINNKPRSGGITHEIIDVTNYKALFEKGSKEEA